MIEGALLNTPVVSGNGIFSWLFRCLVKVRYPFFLTAVLLGPRSPSVTDLAMPR